MKKGIIGAALVIYSLIAFSQREVFQTIFVVGDEKSTWEAWFLGGTTEKPEWVIIPSLTLQDTQGGSEIYRKAAIKYVHKKIDDPSFYQEVVVLCSKKKRNAFYIIPDCELTIIKDYKVIDGCPTTITGIQKL
jgi:hypothetical protein